MLLKDIDARFVSQVFISGANNISNKKEYINELNVFPVPDGDTGTNMTLTIMSAVAEVKSIKEPSVTTLSKAISGGSLRGARGNSGVILSQLMRGFCKDIVKKDVVTLETIASAFVHATETAYKAVMKPKEGTILTVAKAMAEKAAELLSTEDDIIEFLEKVVEAGDEALAGTPDLLPVLKEAGVVDSGGQGLMEIMKGFLSALKGQPVELNNADDSPKLARGAGLLEDIPTIRPSYNVGSGRDDISTADIKYGYCTEFIIILDKEIPDSEVAKIKEYMLSIGDSLVCVNDEEVVKIHIHTNHPGLAFEKGLEYGQLTRCKIDNMREEHEERVSFIQDEKEPKSKYGFVAVSAGDGLAEIYSEIGVNHIIHGGQTMNPSTDDIVSAVQSVNAENVFILPNNKNIILAANQVKDIVEDKNVYVVSSFSIPQGISAMLEFNDSLEPEENLEGMNEAVKNVKTGEITFAVRDTSVEGKEIHKNNIMGISDKGIDVVGTDVDEVAKDLIAKLVDEDSGLISIYYGEDVSEEKANELAAVIAEKYDDLEIEVKYGGQPIYYYILSVE